MMAGLRFWHKKTLDKIGVTFKVTRVVKNWRKEKLQCLEYLHTDSSNERVLAIVSD